MGVAKGPPRALVSSVKMHFGSNREMIMDLFTKLYVFLSVTNDRNRSLVLPQFHCLDNCHNLSHMDNIQHYHQFGDNPHSSLVHRILQKMVAFEACMDYKQVGVGQN